MQGREVYMSHKLHDPILFVKPPGATQMGLLLMIMTIRS